MRIGVEMRRLLIISTRIMYSILFGHPFLVGMVCFCIFLYVYFPFLFSLLVSASPIVVCTAILLGTLLLFGEVKVPEIEKEKVEDEETEVSHEISLSPRVFENASAVVERDESFSTDRIMKKRKDRSKKAMDEEQSLLDNNASELQNGGCLFGYISLNDDGFHDTELRKRVIEKVERGFDDLEKKRKMQEEILGIKEVLIGNHYSMIQHMEEENLKAKNNKLVAEFTEDGEGTHLDFAQKSSWEQFDDDENDGSDDEEYEEEASDSGSDGIESSSPSASVEDILPMLDELHPLLDVETPRPTHISPNGSIAGSSSSHKSSESIVGTDDDMMKHVDGVDGDDEDNDTKKYRDVEDEDEAFDNESNDNDEEEEEAQGGKEDESKSAIKWTEDDQKIVMDVGTLELERNQRLENLIAKRIAHRNLSMIAERNLIDLDGADLPTNIPSISTRRNPFDYDDDSPGSAPSIFLPRRNPFDLPYDSIEKKPHLKENNFRHEFVSPQQREPFFRRHQSFNVGPSFLGVGNIERQDFRWKPYFSPDRNGYEGTSYDTFERQLSGASDSKVSSNPDTDSVSSTVEEKKLSEEDVSQETEIISNVDHGSILVEHGSLSSEDVDSTDDQKVEESDEHHDENRLVENLNNHEVVSRLSASEETAPIELNISEILLRMETDEEEEYVSRSTLSSLSEREDIMFEMNKESTIPEQKDGQTEEYLHVNPAEEQASTMDETSQFKQDKVWSSIADKNIGSDFLPDMNADVVPSESSDKHSPLDASYQGDLEKQHSWSDKSMVRTSFDNHDQPTDLNQTPEWSAEGTSIAKNVDTQNSMAENTTLYSSSASPKSLKDKSFVGEVDLKDDIHDKVVFHEDNGHIIANDNYSEEAYKSPATEGNVGDEEDDIKEINEGLFSKLNATGDFLDKEVAGETCGEQEHESRIGSPKFDSLPNDPSLTEIREELIALGVRSGEDIHISFKQIDEDDIVQEVIDSKMIREQKVEGKHQASEETHSNGKATEASSLQDIDNSVKLILEGNMMELSEPSHSKEVIENIDGENSQNLPQIDPDLENIEARSLDETDLNNKEASQTNIEEEQDWFDSSDSLVESIEVDKDETELRTTSDMGIHLMNQAIEMSSTRENGSNNVESTASQTKTS